MGGLSSKGLGDSPPSIFPLQLEKRSRAVNGASFKPAKEGRKKKERGEQNPPSAPSSQKGGGGGGEGG